MLGRRGPVQAAFTPPELKELGELARRRRDRRPGRPRARSRERARARGRPRARAPQHRPAARVRRAAARRASRAASSCASSPRRSRSSATDRVEAVEVVRNELVEEDGRIVARPTGETRGDPGRARAAERRLQGRRRCPACRSTRRGGTIPNDGGRVAGAERTYAAGWIKRGPSGVIGTNKKDATETVELLLEDARAGQARVAPGGDLERAARRRAASSYVEHAGWQAIDAAERAAGEPLGRPRVKLARWESLLDVGSTIRAVTRALGRRDDEGGRATSPSPASRSRRPSRAGSAGSRRRPRA